MKLHLYDWFIIAIFILMVSNGFFAYKAFSYYRDSEQRDRREMLAKAEFESLMSYHRADKSMAIKRAKYFEAKYREKINQKIVYKKIYEKILVYPDSLQHQLTDSILTECRVKPFTGGQLLFE